MIKGYSKKHNVFFGVENIDVMGGQRASQINADLQSEISNTVDKFVDLFNDKKINKTITIVSMFISRSWDFYVELNSGDVIQLANLFYSGPVFGDFDIVSGGKASNVLTGSVSNILMSCKNKGAIADCINSNASFDKKKTLIKPSVKSFEISNFSDGSVNTINVNAYNSLIFDYGPLFWDGNVAHRLRDWVVDKYLFPDNLYDMNNIDTTYGKKIYIFQKADKLRHNCCFNIISPISLLLAYDSIKLLKQNINVLNLDSQLLTHESDNDRFVNSEPYLGFYGNKGNTRSTTFMNILLKPGVTISKEVKITHINNKLWPVCLLQPTVHNISNYLPNNLVQSYYNYAALMFSYYVNFNCTDRYYPCIGFYKPSYWSGAVNSYNWTVSKLQSYNYVEEFKNLYKEPFNIINRFCSNIRTQLVELLAVSLIDNEIDNYLTWDVVMLSKRIFKIFDRLYAFNNFINEHHIPDEDASIYWIYYIVASMNTLMDFPAYEGDVPEFPKYYANEFTAYTEEFFFVTYCRIILLDMLLMDYRRVDGI